MIALRHIFIFALFWTTATEVVSLDSSYTRDMVWRWRSRAHYLLYLPTLPHPAYTFFDSTYCTTPIHVAVSKRGAKIVTRVRWYHPWANRGL